MALCVKCSREFDDFEAFCPHCGSARSDATAAATQASTIPPPPPGTGWSSMRDQGAAEVPAGHARELKSARGVSILAAIAGVGSLLAVLLTPISYVVGLSEGSPFDSKILLDVVITTLLFLVPSTYLALHALGAVRKRDMYPERDRVVVSAIAAALVVLLRFGSLADIASTGELDKFRGESWIWYRWGLVPVEPGMNPLLHLVGLVVLISIGAAVVASVWFIADTKLFNVARKNTLQRVQRRGIIIMLLAVLFQGFIRWNTTQLAYMDVAGALVLAVFAFLGGVVGDRAVTIVGTTVSTLTLAAVLSAIVDGLIFGQFQFTGLLSFALINGLFVFGCMNRCSSDARWKESLRAPLVFFKPQRLG